MFVLSLKLIQVPSSTDNTSDILTLDGPSGNITLQAPGSNQVKIPSSVNLSGGGNLSGTYAASGATISGATLSSTTIQRALNATVSAAGSTQGTATALTAQDNIVTNVGTNSGVILTGTAEMEVLNRDTNTLLVYPPVGGQIESNTTNTAVAIVPGGSARFLPSTALQWYVK